MNDNNIIWKNQVDNNTLTVIFDVDDDYSTNYAGTLKIPNGITIQGRCNQPGSITILDGYSKAIATVS